MDKPTGAITPSATEAIKPEYGGRYPVTNGTMSSIVVPQAVVIDT